MIEQASLIIGDGNWAVKSDSLLGYALPQGKYTPREMSVVRATTGTRVNAEGLVEVVPYNLVQYSEQIDNAIWVKGDAAISANSAIAPNGTNTADKFIANSNNAAHLFYQAVPTGSCSFSIYAKAAEETVFSMWLNDFSKNARFDLSTGTVVFSNVTSANITDVGNGWFRCEVYDTTLTSFVAIFGRNAAAYIGNGVDGMFFWGAQAVEGTEAKDYLPTTDRLDIARIDYSTGSPALLVEPQRTNTITYSEDINNSFAAKVGVTITPNNTTSPDGTQNADLLKFDSTSGYVLRGQIVAPLTTYTMSVFVKNNNFTSGQLLIFNMSDGVIGGVYAQINLVAKTAIYGGVESGAWTSVSGKVEDFGSGWFRVSVTGTSVGGGSGWYEMAAPGVTNSCFVWGFQLELGSYPTSYIPTTSASVTRNGDDIYKTGISSLIGQAEGTMFFDGIVNNIQNSSTNILNTNKNPSINSQIALVKEKNTNKIKFQQFFGNGTFDSITLNATNTFANGTRTKVAIRYKSGDFAMYINGNLEATSSLTFTNIGTKTELFLNDIQTIYAYQESVSFNAVALWKSPLTNTQLAELTTL
jgi:hypothetical protein